ncbi:polysaccharide biosynthesis/export family protein, partial [Campylobacter lari]
MRKIFLFLLLPLFLFSAVDVSQIAKTQADSIKQIQDKEFLQSDLNKTAIINAKVFGAHLFNGNFTKFTQHVYNPDYKLAVGDRINVKIWGAVEFIQTLTVDSQGNIFIPKVGAINLLGVKNSALVQVITKAINKIYKSNVYVYADMD